MRLILIMMKVSHLNIASKFMNQNNPTLHNVRPLYASSEINKVSHKLRTLQKN